MELEANREKKKLSPPFRLSQPLSENFGRLQFPVRKKRKEPYTAPPPLRGLWRTHNREVGEDSLADISTYHAHGGS